MSDDEAMAKAEETAEEIKEAYANSMKKWNDIYYYSYDEDGNRVKNKVINVVEGTETTSNLIIYPIDYYYTDNDDDKDDIKYVASICASGEGTILSNGSNGILHRHYSNWIMNVNVHYFYEHGALDGNTPEFDSPYINEATSISSRERAGQHELGHVLGLQDIDHICDPEAPVGHHSEVLMGYGINRSTYAKYKDIAGVSITRGFHTDADHVWMLRTNDNGTQDVICAQCNGVRKNITLVDGKYEGKSVNTYKSCVHHGGSNEEMLLVATDGIRNFFKCQYCRHIETVDLDNIFVSTCSETTIFKEMSVFKAYLKLVVKRSTTYKFQANDVNNFIIYLYDDNLNEIDRVFDDTLLENEYTIHLNEGTYYLRITHSIAGTESYSFSITPSYSHSYTDWKRLSSTHHIECCEYCGQTGTETGLHTIIKSEVTLNIAHCIHCGAKVMLGDDIVQVPEMLNVQKVSINGSYILPNGIIVLVDEDIEAYENGTLVFYDRDDLPQVQ